MASKKVLPEKLPSRSWFECLDLLREQNLVRREGADQPGRWSCVKLINTELGRRRSAIDNDSTEFCMLLIAAGEEQA